jgi:hypothetical protein
MVTFKMKVSHIMKLADSVLHRIVQIVQEAMLTGKDCADLMREVDLTVDVEDPHCLVLTPEYVANVKKYHQQLLDRVMEENAKKDAFSVVNFDFSKKISN